MTPGIRKERTELNSGNCSCNQLEVTGKANMADDFNKNRC